jgi:hypothetical protein
MGAVCHPSSPPSVLRSFLRECCVGRWGRVAVDTAHNMMIDGSRVQYTSVDITRSAALLIQHYGTTG